MKGSETGRTEQRGHFSQFPETSRHLRINLTFDVFEGGHIENQKINSAMMKSNKLKGIQG